MAGREGVFFGIPAFWIGCVAALLTSFYSWRLIFMTFHGTYRGPKDVYDHAHDPKFAMAMPLVVLAVGTTNSMQVVGRTQGPKTQGMV